MAFDVDIRTFPGGHLTTSEHPELLADATRELADAHGVGPPSATPPQRSPELQRPCAQRAARPTTTTTQETIA
jgi:hypothetical protein